MKDYPINQHQRTTFHPPCNKGQVIQFDPEQRCGVIKGNNGEEIPFFRLPLNEHVNIGNPVLYGRSPQVKFFNKWNAINIQRAYISRDDCFIIDSRLSHVHGDLKKRLQTIIGRIRCGHRNYFYETVIFKDIIGKSNCVTVSWEDEIVYAKREGRNKYSKFVKNRDGEPTNSVSIFLMRKQEFYIIKSCYYGNLKESDPSNEGIEGYETFWLNHALVFGSEPIDQKTITSVCPWTGINENNRLGSLFK